MSSRLVKHLEDNNILSRRQYAYRRGRNTELAITEYINTVMESFANNSFTASVFLDLTRAFDCVSHDILLKKMDHYGVRDHALNWFETYLRDRKQYVTYEGESLDTKTVNIGVPQGSILGPIFFLIYINDIENACQDGDLILFADDATYFKCGRDINELIKTINRNLKLLVKWFNANRLSVNIIKTESMIHTRRNIYFPLPPIMVIEIPIPNNFTIKSLGIFIDFKLTWKPHLEYVQRKLSSACGLLYNIRNKITRPVARIIYFAIVYPYLNYGNILWSSSYKTSLHRIYITQKKILRCIL